MPSTIWNKYNIVKEINSNSKIKTYLTKIEPIVKEITPKDEDEYYIIIERLEKLKQQFNIYEIIKENEKIYIVLENNDEVLSKIDELILSDELDVKKEGIIQGHGNPITKEEIFNLFNMDKSMCKITFETLKGEKGKGSGFFCKIDNFPIKYALFTNHHVLSESNIEIGKTINLEYLELQKSLLYLSSSYKIVNKQIKITEKRKVFTNKKLDYTCIELFESDGIIKFFKIEPDLFQHNKNFLENNDIFILQYPLGNELSFSYGKILSLKDNKIMHSASTNVGSSGSPIIRRCKDNYIIGLHFGGVTNKKKEYICNLATAFDSILDNIKEQLNEIICIYIPNKNEKAINLIHNYDLDINDWSEDSKNEYLESKNVNEKLFEENIDLYINEKKVKFNFKYKIQDSKEIKVRFKFKKALANTSYMFYLCQSLKSIDLSLFNAINVNNMKYMFYNCSSLETIDLSSFNTTNVKDMSNMFFNCSSLKSIDLSSFNTSNVKDMNSMFYNCSSLKSIYLSLINTTNVENMRNIFYKCSSLESIDLSSFNTSNVKDMHCMFFNCSSLKSINLASFSTINVKDMSCMFQNCTSLKSINLSSFNTINVYNMNRMFNNCSSLESIDLILFNTDNVNYMSEMFSGCASLKSIDLCSFNTIKVKDMHCMFKNCSSLKSLDLSSFNSTNVNNMNDMFSGCLSLKKENITIENKNDKLLNEIK